MPNRPAIRGAQRIQAEEDHRPQRRARLPSLLSANAAQVASGLIIHAAPTKAITTSMARVWKGRDGAASTGSTISSPISTTYIRRAKHLARAG